MNRRGFLSLSLLAPVAGVMAARDAMAAPAISDRIFAQGIAGEFFVGEGFDGSLLKPLNVVRKLRVEVETFGVDDPSLQRKIMEFDRAAQEERARLLQALEDESVSAQFESDLAFLQDEPGVAI
jgi:hypothetical protein